MQIKILNSENENLWDNYVKTHSRATHCHLFAWKKIIEQTYHLQSYYIYAINESKVVGILPLFNIKSRIFGNHLVSMPFLNYGGILTDSDQVAHQIHLYALELFKELNSSSLEYRYPESGPFSFPIPSESKANTYKVRMILNLPQNGEVLFQSFNAKLRSQIRRPSKEGMTCTISGECLLNDFYIVFARNMRDLGSPVHSPVFFKNIVKYLNQNARIGIVYYQRKPVAAGLIIHFHDTIEIPWASALKRFKTYSPNMLLYWSFLEYASNQGFKFFDFGRSSPDEGTFRFKQQWGAESRQLYWYQTFSNRHNDHHHSLDHKSTQRQLMASLWKKLPLVVANYFGPRIRYKISL
jgi:serine/alanine adding enzyme